MLTTAAARAARPRARAYRLAAGGGLCLAIMPGGTKSWRLRWRDARGREQLLTIGTFPAIGVDAARARRDELRAAIAAGADPRAARTEVNYDFETAARAWHAHRAPGWSAVHAEDVMTSLERDVFPAIGAMPLAAVTPPVVLRLLRLIEARGAIETARRVQQRIELVFAFARAEGWVAGDNPATRVEAALANTPAKGRQPALVDVGQMLALMAAVDALPGVLPAIARAHRFLALTAVRLATLRGMRWGEVERLDGPEPLWRVPAARMKLKLVNKQDAERDHLVPLSRAAVHLLGEVRALELAPPAPDDLVFTGRGGIGPIGAGAIGELYARAGFAGRHVPHGWRASFSTIMNRRRPADRAAIDRALGHVLTGVSEKEGAYNREQHLELRRELLEEWAAVLEA